MNMKKIDHNKAILSAIDDIQELLKKSMPLQKDDEQFPEQQPEMGEDQGMPQEQPEMSEQFPEQQPEMGEDQGMSEDQGMPEQGQDEVSEIGQMASELSDEDLSGLIEMLSQELQSRQQPQEQAPMESPAPEMDKSAEIGMLQKSVKAMQAEINSLKAAKVNKPVANRAASTQRVAVVEKSTKEAPKPQRLTKSETEDFLMGRIRSKDPNVSSKQLIDLQYVRSDEALEAFQDSLVSKGIELPKK